MVSPLQPQCICGDLKWGIRIYKNSSNITDSICRRKRRCIWNWGSWIRSKRNWHCNNSQAFSFSSNLLQISLPQKHEKTILSPIFTMSVHKIKQHKKEETLYHWLQKRSKIGKATIPSWEKAMKLSWVLWSGASTYLCKLQDEVGEKEKKVRERRRKSYKISIGEKKEEL